jgi:hypothetical protein
MLTLVSGKMKSSWVSGTWRKSLEAMRWYRRWSRRKRCARSIDSTERQNGSDCTAKQFPGRGQGDGHGGEGMTNELVRHQGEVTRPIHLNAVIIIDLMRGSTISARNIRASLKCEDSIKHLNGCARQPCLWLAWSTAARMRRESSRVGKSNPQLPGSCLHDGICQIYENVQMKTHRPSATSASTASIRSRLTERP